MSVLVSRNVALLWMILCHHEKQQGEILKSYIEQTPVMLLQLNGVILLVEDSDCMEIPTSSMKLIF